jgi:hypothetical protein
LESTGNRLLRAAPIERQARVCEAAVNASRKGANDERNAPYRLYEVQNGNHIEAYALAFPALRVIQPHAQQRPSTCSLPTSNRTRRSAAEPVHTEGRYDRPVAHGTGQLREPLPALIDP